MNDGGSRARKVIWARPIQPKAAEAHIPNKHSHIPASLPETCQALSPLPSLAHSLPQAVAGRSASLKGGRQGGSNPSECLLNPRRSLSLLFPPAQSTRSQPSQFVRSLLQAFLGYCFNQTWFQQPLHASHITSHHIKSLPTRLRTVRAGQPPSELSEQASKPGRQTDRQANRKRDRGTER